MTINSKNVVAADPAVFLESNFVGLTSLTLDWSVHKYFIHDVMFGPARMLE